MTPNRILWYEPLNYSSKVRTKGFPTRLPTRPEGFERVWSVSHLNISINLHSSFRDIVIGYNSINHPCSPRLHLRYDLPYISPYVGKMLESILAHRLDLFLFRSGHTDPCQEGFTRKRNTVRYLNRLHLSIKGDRQKANSVMPLPGHGKSV